LGQWLTVARIYASGWPDTLPLGRPLRSQSVGNRMRSYPDLCIQIDTRGPFGIVCSSAQGITLEQRRGETYGLEKLIASRVHVDRWGHPPRLCTGQKQTQGSWLTCPLAGLRDLDRRDGPDRKRSHPQNPLKGPTSGDPDKRCEPAISALGSPNKF